MAATRDDRILPATRIAAALIIPFLVLAFLILYFVPDQSGERFAWRIDPPVMAAYVGAGYIGGAYLFVHVLFGRSWHRVAAGFPAVTAFTVSMLLVTWLHWNRYSVDHFPFQLWFGLYLVTPILVPALWALNRGRDPGTAQDDDPAVPRAVRTLVGVFGVGLGLIVVASFVEPRLLISFWPWPLTELTAHLLAGWGALLAVSNLYVAFEPRWSAWRIGVQSIALWHILYLAAAIMHPQDFTQGLLNWHVLSVTAILVAMMGLYMTMERRIRTRSSPRPVGAR